MPEILAENLDDAWVQAVRAACGARKGEVSPLVVSFNVPRGDREDSSLRQSLNEVLVEAGHATVETVANTLFPVALWNRSRPRQQLFDRYLKILPTLRRLNRRGLYFERLINYPGTRGKQGMNQLDHIIETFKSGTHRRSALQAAVLHPMTDLTKARQQGFPCLQQIGFANHAERGTLTLTAFYPMQYLFERAYGNYLGLSRIGIFMAHEMALSLERVICIAGVGKLEVAASEFHPLISKFSDALNKSVTKWGHA